MIKEYKIKISESGNGNVIEYTTIFGKRIAVDESEPDEITKQIVYTGRLCDCYAYVQIVKNNLLEK